MSITDTTQRTYGLPPVDPGYRRRPFLLGPGQPLVAAGDPIQSILDYQSSITAIGIPAEHMVASRMAAIAVPENSGRPPDRSGRRYPGTRPEAMWFPLLWLPQRLATRSRFQIVDGEVFAIDRSLTGPNILSKPAAGFEVYTETQDLWVVRVALEMEESGVYDTETGTWFDVLAHVGIDIDNHVDVDRVRRWLSGDVDNDLDLLDTGLEMDRIITDPDDPTWALSSALAIHQTMLDRVWALGADALLGMTDDLTVSIMAGEVSDAKQAKHILSMVCTMASSWMQWYQARPSDAKQAESTWWKEMASAVTKSTGRLDDLASGPLHTISSRLQSIREDCWDRAGLPTRQQQR